MKEVIHPDDVAWFKHKVEKLENTYKKLHLFLLIIWLLSPIVGYFICQIIIELPDSYFEIFFDDGHLNTVHGVHELRDFKSDMFIYVFAIICGIATLTFIKTNKIFRKKIKHYKEAHTTAIIKNAVRQYEENDKKNDKFIPWQELDNISQYKDELKLLESRDQREKYTKWIGFLRLIIGIPLLIFTLNTAHIFFNADNSSYGFSGAIAGASTIVLCLFTFIILAGSTRWLGRNERLNRIAHLKEIIPLLERLLTKSSSNFKDQSQKSSAAFQDTNDSSKIDDFISQEHLKQLHNMQIKGKQTMIFAIFVTWLLMCLISWDVVFLSIITEIKFPTWYDFFSGFCMWLSFLSAARYAQASFQRKVKQLVYPDLSKSIGLEYKLESVIDKKMIIKHGIFPNHEYVYIDDAFSGIYNDRKIEFQEFITATSVPLELREDRSYKDRGGVKKKLKDVGPKAFLKKAKNDFSNSRGVICRIQLRKKLYSHTVAYKTGIRKLPFMNKNDFKFIELLNNEIKSYYKVLSKDNMEARYIFDPAFMERFTSLCEHLGAQNFAASFNDNELMIITFTDSDLFETGSIFKPLELEDFEVLYRHTKAYTQIIDLLNLDPDMGL